MTGRSVDWNRQIPTLSALAVTGGLGASLFGTRNKKNRVRNILLGATSLPAAYALYRGTGGHNKAIDSITDKFNNSVIDFVKQKNSTTTTKPEDSSASAAPPAAATPVTADDIKKEERRLEELAKKHARAMELAKYIDAYQKETDEGAKEYYVKADKYDNAPAFSTQDALDERNLEYLRTKYPDFTLDQAKTVMDSVHGLIPSRLVMEEPVDAEGHSVGPLTETYKAILSPEIPRPDLPDLPKITWKEAPSYRSLRDTSLPSIPDLTKLPKSKRTEATSYKPISNNFSNSFDWYLQLPQEQQDKIQLARLMLDDDERTRERNERLSKNPYITGKNAYGHPYFSADERFNATKPLYLNGWLQQRANGIELQKQYLEHLLEDMNLGDDWMTYDPEAELREFRRTHNISPDSAYNTFNNIPSTANPNIPREKLPIAVAMRVLNLTNNRTFV